MTYKTTFEVAFAEIIKGYLFPDVMRPTAINFQYVLPCIRADL